MFKRKHVKQLKEEKVEKQDYSLGLKAEASRDGGRRKRLRSR